MVIFELRGIDYPRKQTKFTLSTDLEKMEKCLKMPFLEFLGTRGFLGGFQGVQWGRHLVEKSTADSQKISRGSQLLKNRVWRLVLRSRMDLARIPLTFF